jgi:hypothetical protein
MKPGLIVNISILIYGLSFLTSFLPKAKILPRLGLYLATIIGFYYIFLRYWFSWPMTPMFLGTVAVPPVLSLFGLIGLKFYQEPQKTIFLRLLLLLSFFLGLLSLFFPKDFYLPFLKTASPFSQLHLIFTILGKAALFNSGLKALMFLLYYRKTNSFPNRKLFFNWLALGFTFWTLSMFCGEIWSYLCWGLPVVWDDAVIVNFMASWFFFITLLHLHLNGIFTINKRAALSTFGIIWLLTVNCLPDLGPFRWPIK